LQKWHYQDISTLLMRCLSCQYAQVLFIA
jgi:hypothetical protein